MSHDATVAAWAHIRSTPDMDMHQVLVLLALADRYNSLTGKLNPSIGRIAADCHISPASVKRALHRMVESGLIARGSGGGATSNTYALLFHNPVPAAPGSDSTRFRVSQHLAPTDPPPGAVGATNQERTKKEPMRPLFSQTTNTDADPACTDCAGSGWATLDHATNTVGRCACMVGTPLRVVGGSR